MTELLLSGLDAKNPLAFMAALGVLNAVADQRPSDAPEPKLAFRTSGLFTPVLVDGPDREALLDLLWQDLRSFAAEPAFELRYEKAKGSSAHDLKPPPEQYVAYLRGLIATGTRRSLDYAAAFATDVAVDNNGNTKPTALHFTAGQQEFLKMLCALREGLQPADLEEALFGPWRYASPLPILQWDNASARDYALRASNPSTDKKLGVPAADWLAVRGLPFFPVFPDVTRAGISTTGVQGGWKTGSFRWPLWSGALSRSVIRALLSSDELFRLDPKSTRVRGIDVVLEAGIRRSDQGGYGSFTPAGVAQPREGRKR